MSILSTLQAVKKTRSIKKHPLTEYGIEFSFLYVVGCALVTTIHEDVIAKEYEAIEKLSLSLQLQEEQVNEVISVSRTCDEEKIKELIQALHNKREQILFLLDLYKIAYADGQHTDEQQEIITVFAEMFKLREEEISFLSAFSLAVSKQDTIVAEQALQQAYAEKVEISFDDVRYFIGNLSYKEEINGLELTHGEKLRLARSFLLKGEIIVGSGAELDISGSEITFSDNACIIVNGGVFKADGVKLIATEGSQTTLIRIKDTLQLRLKDVHVNGNHIARAIELNNSTMVIEKSTFENCYHEQNGGAICHLGGHLKIVETTFQDNQVLGKGGALYLTTDTVIQECSFKYCTANYGGGIYAESRKVEIENTIYEKCFSKGHGGGIRLYNIKEGLIKNNNFIECVALKRGGAISRLSSQSVVREGVNFTACIPDNSE